MVRYGGSAICVNVGLGRGIASNRWDRECRERFMRESTGSVEKLPRSVMAVIIVQRWMDVRIVVR